jgi:putative FmdB family regulatory protein
MPIYEYRCDQGHTFEVLRRMSDEPLSVCETCAAPVEQVFHPIAIHFKGKGFYNTDYGTKKRSREMQESKGAETAKSEAGAGDAKSESKSAEAAKPSEAAKPAAAAKAEKPASPAPKPKD